MTCDTPVAAACRVSVVSLTGCWQVMDELGNEAAAAKYLLKVPVSYKRPEKDSPM